MSTIVPATPPPQTREPRFDQLRVLLRSPTFVVGVVIVVWWVVCALAGQWIAPLDAYASDPLNSLTPPDHTHWFGTDQLGRDVFSRVIVGARDILTIAPLATLLGTVAGTALGLVVGYFEGWVDNVVGRAIDAVLALPLVIVALLALAAVGASNFTVILVIGITFTPITARTVRAAVFAERHVSRSDISQPKASASCISRATLGMTSPRSMRDTASLPIPSRSATCS